MTGTVGIIGGNDQQLNDLVRAAGMRPVQLQGEHLLKSGLIATPEVLLVDLRADRELLASIPAIKRRFPSMGIAILALSLDPTLMLEAMRAGVTECITEPLTQASIESAISHVVVQRAATVEGRVFAVVGAKGGVGTTTIAVNLAEALAQASSSALLVDLHAANGDAVVFLGVEPKFTVTDAVENTHRLDEAFFRGLVAHTRSGLDLLASSPRLAAGHLDPQRVRTIIEFAVRYYPAVVLDVPRMDGPILDALDVAALILVVVNHELPTIRSAFRFVARLRQRYGDDRVAVVVNRSDNQAEISVGDIEKAVGARIRHAFPNDYKQAVLAVNRGEPLAQSTQGRLAASFHALARELNGQGKKTAAAEESTRLFGWLTPRRSSD
ncbi:MAG: AAA family ATPase [Acidobacteriota bacterium]